MSALDEVKKELPEDSMISEAKYEGSDIVFYTKNRDFFLDNEDEVRKLVSKLKKRVEVRPASSITLDPEDAKKEIREIVPEDAGLDDIIFQPDFGRVILRAEKPGLVIGKNGDTLNQIKKDTRWMPKVERVPAINSKVVDRARELTVGNSSFRKKFLHKVGKKIRLEKSVGKEWVRITALGGYRQVGRNCHLLQTEESKVMVDCGVDVGRTGRDSYPYLNVPEVDFKDLDAVVLTHSHLDHCGLIPFLYEYGYDGPLYCTEPTRDLMILLALDYIDVIKSQGKKAPYDSSSIKKAVERCIPLEYGEVADITPDMRLTLNDAGHILGSAAAHLHIGEGLHNVVFSGDIRFDQSELLNRANPNFNRVETLVCESTYVGNKDLPSREEGIEKFLEEVEETIEKGGKVIVPAFAVGRAQELMIILSKHFKDVPVHLDGMIWAATALHTAYPEYLSEDVQKRIFHKGENPFLSENFHRVGSRKEREEVVDDEPCIILTTSGSLAGGPALYYLEKLAEDEKNKLIFVGYQFKGSLGRKIQNGEKKVSLNGDSKDQVEINLDIVTAQGFGGHSDRSGLMDYVSNLQNKPNKVIVMHGDNSAPFNLASSLHKMYNMETTVPQNLETVRLV